MRPYVNWLRRPLCTAQLLVYRSDAEAIKFGRISHHGEKLLMGWHLHTRDRVSWDHRVWIVSYQVHAL